MNENTEKYLSCTWAHSGLEFKPDSIRSCCFFCLYNQNEEAITLAENYRGEIINWDELFLKKNKLKLSNKNKNYLAECKKCSNLKIKEWDDRNYIDAILFNQWTQCNSNCIYCKTKNDKNYQKISTYKISPILKEMIQKKILINTPDSFVDFGGGEVTLLDEFDEIINILLNFGINEIIINSSGIEYSNTIANILALGKTILTISIDSASSKTYKKIKQVDKFLNVVENIKKYYNALPENKKNNLLVKYIIIPGINDNIKEIDLFFSLLSSIGIKSIILTIESHYLTKNNNFIPKNVEFLYKYISTKAKKNRINIDYFYNPASKNNNSTQMDFFASNSALAKAYLAFYKLKYSHMNVDYKTLFNND